MLQRPHAPGIDPRPALTVKGLEHLKDEWVTLLRWLAEGKVEHVVIGPAGEAIRGRVDAEGPLGITPAPYHRNLDRLARALVGAHARLRTDGEQTLAAVRFSARNLAAGERWKLRCEGRYDFDIQMAPPSRYSELLYESGKFEIEPGMKVEVAALEDLEHHSHVLLTGEEPEIRISRGPVVPHSHG